MTIVEFLLARLDEWESDADSTHGSCSSEIGLACDCGLPNLIRADVAAKRRIIELHRPIEDKSWLSGEPNNWLWCTSCGSTDDRPIAYPCDTLRLLAQPYADHPDFDPAWSVA